MLYPSTCGPAGSNRGAIFLLASAPGEAKFCPTDLPVDTRGAGSGDEHYVALSRPQSRETCAPVESFLITGICNECAANVRRIALRFFYDLKKGLLTAIALIKKIADGASLGLFQSQNASSRRL
jgi:hypothetical protein